MSNNSVNRRTKQKTHNNPEKKARGCQKHKGALENGTEKLSATLKRRRGSQHSGAGDDDDVKQVCVCSNPAEVFINHVFGEYLGAVG